MTETSEQLAEYRASLVKGGDAYRTDAKRWREVADKVAKVDLRLAARCRDVAFALADYAMLCADIVRSEHL